MVTEALLLGGRRPRLHAMGCLLVLLCACGGSEPPAASAKDRRSDLTAGGNAVPTRPVRVVLLTEAGFNDGRATRIIFRPTDRTAFMEHGYADAVQDALEPSEAVLKVKTLYPRKPIEDPPCQVGEVELPLPIDMKLGVYVLFTADGVGSDDWKVLVDPPPSGKVVLYLGQHRISWRGGDDE